MFAINLLLKLEQMYLENRVGIVLHLWPHTKAGHTLQHAQTFGMYLHHEDAGQRRAVVLQLDIRGGVTDLPAQAIAVHHPSADAVMSPQITLSLTHLPSQQGGTYLRAGNPYPVMLHTANRMHHPSADAVMSPQITLSLTHLPSQQGGTYLRAGNPY